MIKHHGISQYEISFLYNLYERRQTRFADFTEFKLKLGLIVFIVGCLFLIAAATLSMDILTDNYVFILITIIPPAITSWVGRREMFFLFGVQVKDRRVYALPLPRWILWACTCFTNLMVVGSLSLLLFTAVCFAFSGDELTKEQIFVKKIDINNNNKTKDADIVFEDGLRTRIYNIALNIDGENWKESSKQTIFVKKTIFGIKILQKTRNASDSTQDT